MCLSIWEGRRDLRVALIRFLIGVHQLISYDLNRLSFVITVPRCFTRYTGINMFQNKTLLSYQGIDHLHTKFLYRSTTSQNLKFPFWKNWPGSVDRVWSLERILIISMIAKNNSLAAKLWLTIIVWFMDNSTQWIQCGLRSRRHDRYRYTWHSNL